MRKIVPDLHAWAAEHFRPAPPFGVPWRDIVAARLLGETSSGMRDTWRYVAKANPLPDQQRRLLIHIVNATDTVPELVMDDASDTEIAAALGLTPQDVNGDARAYALAIRDQRPQIDLQPDPRPELRAPRDPQATLARRLLKNLRLLWYLAPRESRAASQPYLRLYSATIERLAAAFDAAREADRLPWTPAAAAANLVTHRRWTHLGWRQHRRAVDRLRPLIVRDMRALARIAPLHASWLGRACAMIEEIPNATREHAGWIELEAKASALLWARSVDAFIYHSRAHPGCYPGYLRWADFATIAGALFGPLHSGPNAAELIRAAVSAQRRRGPRPDEFAPFRYPAHG